MKAERWIWVGGWGLSPEWFAEYIARAYPGANHTVLAPSPRAIAGVDWRHFDRAGGYSLGAFLLLKNAGQIPLPALLLAPFFAYPAEANLGGRIRGAQIRYLARWLQKEPLPALEDFYQRARLGLTPPAGLPYPMEDLQWGLRQLAEEQVSPRLPEGWTGWIGDGDTLLDAGVLTATEPRLTTVSGAGHHPAALLEAAAP